MNSYLNGAAARRSVQNYCRFGFYDAGLGSGSGAARPRFDEVRKLPHWVSADPATSAKEKSNAAEKGSIHHVCWLLLCRPSVMASAQSELGKQVAEHASGRQRCTKTNGLAHLSTDTSCYYPIHNKTILDLLRRPTTTTRANTTRNHIAVQDSNDFIVKTTGTGLAVQQIVPERR